MKRIPLMRNPLVMVVMIGVAVTVTQLSGCNTPDRPPEVAQRASRNIYDLSLSLDLRDASGAQEYYTVDRDGQFGFGGGLNARFQRVTYTAQLSDDDMRRLRETIESQRLLDGSLTSSNQPKSVYFRIKLKFGDDDLRKNLKGDNDRMQALRVVLRDFATRRLEPELDRQPKASATTRPGGGPTSQPG